MATFIPEVGRIHKLIPYPKKKNLAYYLDGDTYIPVFYSYGLIVKIQDSIANQLSIVQSYHSRVLVGLLQFNLPNGEGTKCNTVMSKFIDKFRYRVEMHYKKLGYFTHVGYVWVREQNSSTAQHYHAAFFVNEQCCAGAYKLWQLAVDIWDELCGGHVIMPTNPELTVKRGDLNSRHIALLRLSYYAKQETKQAKIFIKNYSASRMKRKKGSELY